MPPRVGATSAVFQGPRGLPGSLGQNRRASLTLCSLREKMWFHAKYKTFMFEKTGFNCWWSDQQIGMYLHGEHSDPAKHFSAKKMENRGICHLTQQEPGADGAQLGKSAAAFFFFPLLVVVAPGADIAFETFLWAGLARLCLPGQRLGNQGVRLPEYLALFLGASRAPCMIRGTPPEAGARQALVLHWAQPAPGWVLSGRLQ